MLALLLAQEAEESGLPWYAYLFWLWLIVSMVLLVYRRVQKASAKRQAQGEPGGPPSAPAPSAAAKAPMASSSTPASSTPPKATVPTDEARSDDSPLGEGSLTTTRPPKSPAPARPTGGAAPTGGSGRPGSTAGDSGSGGRSGLFAAAPPPGTEERGARLTVAELLAGITMPCELAPVMLGEPSVAATAGLEVTFSTRMATAPDVGREVGDELERLGFELTSVNDHQVEAQRDDGVLLVSLYTDPGSVERAGRKLFPVLPTGSIVVTFESVA